MVGHRLSAWLTVLAITVVVAGCTTSSGRFDRTETLRLARTELERMLPIGVDSVDCDEIPRREADDRRPCTARTEDGRSVRIDLVVDDPDALHVEILDAVVERDRLVDRIDEQLEERYDRTFTVRCDEPDVLIVEPGATLTCEAEDEDHAGEVEVAILDRDGDVAVRIGTTDEIEPSAQAVP